MAICMPSSFKTDDIQSLGLRDLAAEELELRKGQANDCLKGLQFALGHKAVLFRTKIRNSKTSVGKTRAWADVKAVTVKVGKHVRAYRRARNALERLGADSATMECYQMLRREDLRLSGDITEENRLGQQSDALPWFWRLDGKDAEEQSDWMQECKCYALWKSVLLTFLVYRVNWLRAQAPSERATEELLMVKHEMRWSVNWFQKQQTTWMARGGRSLQEGKPGHQAYAEKQVAMWGRFVEHAKQGFHGKMAD